MTKGEVFVTWEPVYARDMHDVSQVTGYRFRVPRGWIYCTIGHELHIYIPDPNHEWGKEVRDGE